MKIIHLSHSDAGGGAAIAAHRLTVAQRSVGIDARMLVVRKLTADDMVEAPLGAVGRMRVRAARFVAKRVAEFAARDAPETMRTLGLFSTGIGSLIAGEKADIIHLHWLGSEMMSLAEIALLPPPVVWTCHDMWVFCGAEHYATGRRFVDGYQNHGGMDIDRWIFQRKRRLWDGWRPTLICPSTWMAEQAAKSVLMCHASRFTIPNTLNTDIFRPMPRDDARNQLGLPLDGRIVLFGADGGQTDPRKGFDLLVQALAHLPWSTPGNICLATFGNSLKGSTAIEGHQIREFGAIRDAHRLATLYSAADVFVTPSRIDNLPNTLLEAQACGVPCVAFDVGGMRDIIEKPLNGALAPPFDVEALASRICEVLDCCSPGTREQIRADAIARFGQEHIAQRHLDLYRTLLSAKKESVGRREDGNNV